MASQGEDQRPGVAVKPPHFFKIILADSLRHGKLVSIFIDIHLIQEFDTGLL